MRWRLLVDAPNDGATNMAIDECLLHSALDDGVATLRFYRFRSPTVTFGYRQSLEEACRPESCSELRIDCVRRITGGRALLHQHDLTFALAAPASGPFSARGVRESYERVNSAIRTALRRIGVRVDGPRTLAGTPADEPSHLPCLSVPTRHEITSGGRKIVVSAQRRRRNGFLQHGSILRNLDVPLWNRISPPGAGSSLRATGIERVCKRTPSEGELVAELSASFAALFDEEAFESSLLPRERSRVAELVRKYRSAAWTERRMC